jgi:phenylalanyl-tRNA synthetase beta chain
LKKIGVEVNGHIRLANPISSDHTLLRESLAPNLMNNLKANQSKFEDIKIFEIGSIYIGDMFGEEAKNDMPEEKLPYQEKKLGIALASANSDDLFSEAKGIVAVLADYFHLSVSYNQIEALPYWADKNEAAKIVINKRMVGTIFKIADKTRQSIGLKKPSVIAEVSLKELAKAISEQPEITYREYDKFPPAVRDLAIIVDEKMLYNDIKAEILGWHEYIRSVDLFDVYFGEKIGANKKNLAFHIVYQAGKTLTAQEVDDIQAGLVKKLEEKFEAKIRDF